MIRSMRDDIDTVLIDRARLGARIADLGSEITRDLQALHPDPGQIVLLPVLTGAMFFAADLIREIPLKIRVEYVSVTSYPGTATQSRGPRLRIPLPENLGGKHVVIVDDILDSGQTLSLLLDLISRQAPASIRVCVLLHKIKKQETSPPLKADYVGFEIPDAFVVGFGLDYDDYYRNLPEIVTLKRSLLDGSGSP